MVLEASIAPMIYLGILVQAHQLGLSPYLIMGIIGAESAWKWDARGDYALGESSRFPGDWLWLPNEEGLYPHSYGLMQLHIDGAGHGYAPAQLMDITNNLVAGCGYLKRCLEAFDYDWEQAISAYNQGIQGCKDHGIEVNRGYVEHVMSLVWKYAEAHIWLGADVGGRWLVTMEER